MKEEIKEKKNLWDFIIDKRYIIALISLVLFTVFRINNFIGNLKLIACTLITYEFFILLTNNKKYLALIGTFLVMGSSFINLWINQTIEIILLGELFVVVLDKFILSSSIKLRILWNLVLVCTINSYIFISNPEWQISFGYIFLALGIWIIIKNRKEYKFSKFDFLYLLEMIIITASFVFYFWYISNGAIMRFLSNGIKDDIGGNGNIYLFSYLYSFLLPFASNINKMDFVGFLSFFPTPIIMAFIYIYKEEKHYDFLFPLIIALVLETIWCVTGFPPVFSKITLLEFALMEKVSVGISLGCLYLYFYMLANIEEKFIKQTHAMYITLAVLILLFFTPLPKAFDTKKYLYLFVIIETLGSFLLLNMGNKKYQNVFLFFAVTMTIVTQITFNFTSSSADLRTRNIDKKTEKQVVIKDLDNEQNINL